jgi:hypothetical protein
MLRELVPSALHVLVPRISTRERSHSVPDQASQRDCPTTHSVSFLKRCSLAAIYPFAISALAKDHMPQLRFELTSLIWCRRLELQPAGPIVHGRGNLRWRKPPRPSDFANVELVERTDRPPLRFPGMAAHEDPAQAESVGQFGPLQFGGTRCRMPLAGNRQGRYRKRASVLAWRHPCPCRIFWGVHLPLLKVRRNHDVICETDHSGIQRPHAARRADNVFEIGHRGRRV